MGQQNDYTPVYYFDDENQQTEMQAEQTLKDYFGDDLPESLLVQAI